MYSFGFKLIRVGWTLLWLDSLTMPVNNPINIFLINPKIILYHVPFIKYLCISKILLVLIGLKSTENFFTVLSNTVFLYYSL